MAAVVAMRGREGSVASLIAIARKMEAELGHLPGALQASRPTWTAAAHAILLATYAGPDALTFVT